MNSVKVLKAILCDDVRVEITGKSILIGVYTNNIIGINNLPYQLKFSCYIELVADRSEQPLGGKVKVIDCSKEELLNDTLQVFTIERVPVSCYLSDFQILVQEPGTYTLQWQLGAGDWEDVTTFEIKHQQQPFVGADPNASRPSSEQSPRAAPPA
jgi:hypothetical protein